MRKGSGKGQIELPKIRSTRWGDHSFSPSDFEYRRAWRSLTRWTSEIMFTNEVSA